MTVCITILSQSAARLPRRWIAGCYLAVLAEFISKSGLVTGAQKFRLLDPLIARDAPLKPSQTRIDPFDVGDTPCRDLGKAGDALFAEQCGELRAEALDACEIVATG